MQQEFIVPSDHEIVTTRLINAPRETVFRAWTDPDVLKEWWGPKGFTNTFEMFDLRVGGTWRFIMHGPDKGNYKNECVFLKIEEPSLIAWDRSTQPLFRVVATFEEMDDGNTLLTFRMQFAGKEERDKVIGFAGEKNDENFDRLEAELFK